MHPVVTAVSRLLLAPGLVVAVAILLKGTGDVGDGFTAGVIVSLVVALQYLTQGAETVEATLPGLSRAPALIVGGLVVALAAGLGPVLAGLAPFTMFPPPGTEPVAFGAVKLTTALAFETGVFLLVTGTLVTLVHHLAGPPTTEGPA